MIRDIFQDPPKVALWLICGNDLRNFGMNYLEGNELITAGIPVQIRPLFGRHDIKGIET